MRTAPDFWLVVIAFLTMGFLLAPAFTLDDDANNAAANMGERLFLETRFSQFFFTNCGGDVNAIVFNITNSDYAGGEIIEATDTNLILTKGDPVMATLKTIYGPQRGPFAGLSMNCRQCHLSTKCKIIWDRIFPATAPIATSLRAAPFLTSATEIS